MPSAFSVYLVDARPYSDAALEPYLDWLGAAELQRYRRFVRPQRRRQLIIGRVLARRALGAFLLADPRSLSISDAPGKAPVLDGPQRASFSISHSGHWVACAVAGSGIGLDIETIDPTRDIAALAVQAFDAEQCAWLAARPEATRLRDFYQAWSAHEAQIKLGCAPAQTVVLDHPALSVVLCTEHALSEPPQLVAASLDQLRTPISL